MLSPQCQEDGGGNSGVGEGEKGNIRTCNHKGRAIGTVGDQTVEPFGNVLRRHDLVVALNLSSHCTSSILHSLANDVGVCKGGADTNHADTSLLQNLWVGQHPGESHHLWWIWPFLASESKECVITPCFATK